MGYTTKFSGAITLSRKLTLKEAREWMTLYESDGPYPDQEGMPLGRLQWVPSFTLDAIVWDGQEKFYDYVEWMQWLLGWLTLKGIVANGALYWSGENITDHGEIIVENSTVRVSQPQRKAMVGFMPLTMRDLERMALEQITDGSV